jgi:hypothetical protein
VDFSTGGEGEQERDRAADLGENHRIRADKRAYFGTGSAVSHRRIPARFSIEKRLGWKDLYHAEDLLTGDELIRFSNLNCAKLVVGSISIACDQNNAYRSVDSCDLSVTRLRLHFN